MAGHSHWKSIKHKKGAADAKRGKIFSKMAKYITVAARNGGGNPADNLRLRYAIDRARAESMPKDSIERAIKKGTGELQGAALEELTYEGIGLGGCSLIVEVLTDNRNRTGGEIRNLIDKRGGALGKTNSVVWKFQRHGVLEVSLESASETEVFETALEAGAENIETSEVSSIVTTSVEDFEKVRAALEALVLQKRQPTEKKWGEAEDDRPVFLRNELTYTPQNLVPLDDEKARQMLDLLEELEEHEDVQNVYTDLDVPDDQQEE